MIDNATITAWSKRTGSNERGEATYAAQVLARPVRCLRTGLSEAQQRTLAAVGAAADQLLVYPSAGLLSPEIGNGDRVRLDGGDTDHEVVKVDGQDAKGPLTHRKLYVRELAS